MYFNFRILLKLIHFKHYCIVGNEEKLFGKYEEAFFATHLRTAGYMVDQFVWFLCLSARKLIHNEQPETQSIKKDGLPPVPFSAYVGCIWQMWFST